MLEFLFAKCVDSYFSSNMYRIHIVIQTLSTNLFYKEPLVNGKLGMLPPQPPLILRPCL